MFEYHFIPESNIVKALEYKEVIAILYLDTDLFEAQVSMSEPEEEYHYDEMIKASKPDDYDVRAEQGLFGHGY